MMRSFSGTPSGQDLILLGGQLGKASQESHHAPDSLVIMVWTPGRHAGGFDAVFDDPKPMLGPRLKILFPLMRLRQIWWRGIEAQGEITLVLARFEMAAGTHVIVISAPGQQALGPVQIRGHFNPA